jgi:polysaccharide export outer membrane protein
MVTVTMIEYNSRRVSVVGSVMSPQSFQVIGETRLLDALAKAGGPSVEAGPELLLRREGGQTEKFELVKLLSGDSAGMNVLLDGGEEIRVPAAKKIFVVGNITKPQAIVVRQPGDASVLRILAQVEGTTPYYSSTAWIYRDDPVTKERKQIPVPLKAILQRKSPDVMLQPEDVFYIPDDARKRRSADIAKALATGGQSAASALIYVAAR